jgi:ribosomal protein L23
MGILNLKKNKAVSDKVLVLKKTKKLVVADDSNKPAVLSGSTKLFNPSVIIRPRVTEKATMLSEGGRTVAVFEVSRKANKRSIKDAIIGLYKATPEKIAVCKIPLKQKFVRGRLTAGTTRYKAYVYFRPGEKIEII